MIKVRLALYVLPEISKFPTADQAIASCACDTTVDQIKFMAEQMALSLFEGETIQALRKAQRDQQG